MDILFVCHGNICRSPMAEGLLKKKYTENGIEGRIESRGFESFHINEPPDLRAINTARQKGIDIADHVASLFRVEDFDHFEHIFVMDTQNYRDVKELARNQADLDKIDYLLNTVFPGKNRTVPDPFYSGIEDCHKVFELLDLSCDKIVSKALSMKTS